MRFFRSINFNPQYDLLISLHHINFVPFYHRFIFLLDFRILYFRYLFFKKCCALIINVLHAGKYTR